MYKKPEFVIIPGAWHVPESWQPTTSLLSPIYKVHGLRLPALSSPTPLKDFQPEIKLIQNTIRSLIQQNTPLIIIMHSSGGAVGSSALSDDFLDSLDEIAGEENGGKGNEGRKKGRSLILCLIYLSAFVLPKGTSMLNVFGGKPLPWFKFKDGQGEEEGGTDIEEVWAATPEHVFYNDVASQEVPKYVAMLGRHSYKCFASAVEAEPWMVGGKKENGKNKGIRSVYIVCENDNAIPEGKQREMIDRAKEMGGEECFDTVLSTDAGHSPFISQPEWLVEKLVGIAEERMKDLQYGVSGRDE